MASLFPKKTLKINQKVSPKQHLETLTVDINSGLYIGSKCYFESINERKKIMRSNGCLARLPTKPVLAEHETREIVFNPKFQKIRVHLSETQFVAFTIEEALTTETIINMVKSAVLILLDNTMSSVNPLNENLFDTMNQDQYLNTVIRSVNLKYEPCAKTTAKDFRFDTLIINCIDFG